MLAFLGAALVGLVVPSGCVMGPEGGFPSRESVEGMLFGHDRGSKSGYCEASCGTPSDDCGGGECEQTSETKPAGECKECPPTEQHRKWCPHWPKCHLYDPEAGIFNFCVPPQCLNPPPPLPPGRFFPVPVRPAFAQQPESGYGLLNGMGNPNTGRAQSPTAPCP